MREAYKADTTDYTQLQQIVILEAAAKEILVAELGDVAPNTDLIAEVEKLGAAAVGSVPGSTRGTDLHPG